MILNINIKILDSQLKIKFNEKKTLIKHYEMKLKY